MVFSLSHRGLHGALKRKMSLFSTLNACASIVFWKSTCHFDLAPMSKIIIFNNPPPSNNPPLIKPPCRISKLTISPRGLTRGFTYVLNKYLTTFNTYYLQKTGNKILFIPLFPFDFLDLLSSSLWRIMAWGVP